MKKKSNPLPNSKRPEPPSAPPCRMIRDLDIFGHCDECGSSTKGLFNRKCINPFCRTNNTDEYGLPEVEPSDMPPCKPPKREPDPAITVSEVEEVSKELGIEQELLAGDNLLRPILPMILSLHERIQDLEAAISSQECAGVYRYEK